MSGATHLKNVLRMAILTLDDDALDRLAWFIVFYLIFRPRPATETREPLNDPQWEAPVESDRPFMRPPQLENPDWQAPDHGLELD